MATVKDTATTYDRVGNVVSSQVKDGVNNPTTYYSYDAADRKVAQLDPPAQPGASGVSGKSNGTIYTYDAAGNITDTKVVNDPQVQTLQTETTQSYDALNRTTSKTDAANSSTVAQTTTFSYDANSRQTATTTQFNTSSPQTTTTTGYDNLGRPTSVLHPDGSQESSTYDVLGQLLTHTSCGAIGATGTTTYTYGQLGQALAQVLKDCGNTQQSSENDIFDANGNLTQRTTVAGGSGPTIDLFTYDALDRPTGLNDATRQYVLDVLGNVTQMTVAPSPTAPTAVSYTAS
jgi:YD repeat-containing protein